MLLAEDLERFVPIFLFNLHVVVGSPGTLDMERNVALGRLAMHASSLALHADEATQVKALALHLLQFDRCLGSDVQTWDPGGAGNVGPLVQRVRQWSLRRL